MHDFCDTDVMCAAESLIQSNHLIMVADACYASDGFYGWLDVYSYEPISRCVPLLQKVIESIRPHLTARNGGWEWRLFCPDGYLQCYSDGRAVDENGEPCNWNAVAHLHRQPLRVGDKVTRMISGAVPQVLEITKVTEDFIECGGWCFCRHTGVEVDADLDWGPNGKTGSYLKEVWRGRCDG